MSGDILDQIDHAVHDWATSSDAMRWLPEPSKPNLPQAWLSPLPPDGLPAVQAPQITPEQVDAIRAALGQAMGAMAAQITEMARQMQPVLQRFGGQVRELHRQLQDAGVVAEDVPADPMQRALWLRRNRNTGPKQPQRAPKVIGPRGR